MSDISRNILDALNLTSEFSNVETPSIVNPYSKSRVDPAVVNRNYREEHSDLPSECTIKVVTNARVYGTRGSQGSPMAKSAIRLAIDTGLKDPVTFEQSSIKSGPRVRPYDFGRTFSPKESINVIDAFEKTFGGKSTKPFRDFSNRYRAEKLRILSELNISVSSNGQPIFKSDAESAAYFERLKEYSFSFYEVYLSVTPKGMRTTRTKCFRAMSLDELSEVFPYYQFNCEI